MLLFEKDDFKDFIKSLSLTQPMLLQCDLEFVNSGDEPNQEIDMGIISNFDESDKEKKKLSNDYLDNLFNSLLKVDFYFDDNSSISIDLVSTYQSKSTFFLIYCNGKKAILFFENFKK